MQLSVVSVVSEEYRWMMLNEEIFEDYLEYYNTVDTIIIGRNSYSSLAQHWQQAENSTNELERAIAKRMNDIPKMVISHSEVDLVWRNSQQIVVKDDRLFTYADKQQSLHLKNTKSYKNGVVSLHYQK